MATVFEVKVRDKRGKTFTRTVKGDNPNAVRQDLRNKNFTVVGIREKGAGPAAQMSAMFSGVSMDGLNKFFEGKVKLKDLCIFARQFATMINAGVSMVRSLGILAEQAESAKLRRILTDVKEQVEQGQALSDSMGRYPDVFNNLFCGMIKAGEAGGVLDNVLLRVAGFLENQNRLNTQVKSAMAYPLTVMVFALIISAVMLMFIVPMFASMFEQMGAKLPAFTQLLVDLSNLLTSVYAVVGVVFIVLAFQGFRIFQSTPQGALLVDQYKLKLPVLGDLIRKVAVARFSRTLGTLLKSGVPLMPALEIVRDSIGNLIIAGVMEDLRLSVSEGEGLAKPLERAAVFPSMVTQMVSIGEETGSIDAMLDKVADFYDEEVDAAVKALTSMLEPLMMVMIGGIVGSIIIGMYLPIFDIVNKIK
ncbi:MAG: type II secretion system F family protein [Candidatus Sericytochromatia bacterium]|nr:type II secretion system F family protein [Candidatus Sericytochromatia bacterium]